MCTRRGGGPKHTYLFSVFRHSRNIFLCITFVRTLIDELIRGQKRSASICWRVVRVVSRALSSFIRCGNLFRGLPATVGQQGLPDLCSWCTFFTRDGDLFEGSHLVLAESRAHAASQKHRAQCAKICQVKIKGIFFFNDFWRACLCVQEVCNQLPHKHDQKTKKLPRKHEGS